MALFSPFIKIWAVINGSDIDISESISKLTYKREIEKENELKFSVEQNWVARLSDSIMKRGITLKFQYGYKGGEKSDIHQARVVEVAYKYTSKVSMDVTARDLGSVMKKSYSNKVWSGVTTSDICKQIAVGYGLEFKGEITDYVWSNYPQSQKDDWAFLLEIVEKDDSGNLFVYVDDNFLILERRGVDQSSTLSFQYGDGTRIISFDISEQEKTSGMTGGAGTTVTGFDPNKKEKIEGKATDGDLKENIDTGQFGYKYSANGELLNTSNPITDGIGGLIGGGNNNGAGQGGANGGGLLERSLGKKIVTNMKDKKEITDSANSSTKGGKFKVTKGTLKINGEPSLKLNSVVTMRGVLPIHEGNYLIKVITDDVSTSGFITTMEMEKNAGARPNKAGETPTLDSSKVNNTVGGEKLEAVKEVFKFNANGNRIPNPKTEFKVKQ